MTRSPASRVFTTVFVVRLTSSPVVLVTQTSAAFLSSAPGMTSADVAPVRCHMAASVTCARKVMVPEAPAGTGSPMPLELSKEPMVTVKACDTPVLSGAPSTGARMPPSLTVILELLGRPVMLDQSTRMPAGRVSLTVTTASQGTPFSSTASLTQLMEYHTYPPTSTDWPSMLTLLAEVVPEWTSFVTSAGVNVLVKRAVRSSTGVETAVPESSRSCVMVALASSLPLPASVTLTTTR